MVGIQICASNAITLAYGSAFLPSANCLRILSWVLIISPVGYLLGSRVLLVTGHEKNMVLCTGIGAVVNILGNAILIPRFVEYGAAIASVLSEIVVMVMYVNFGKRYFNISGETKNILKVVMASAVIALYCLAMDRLMTGITSLQILVKLIIQVIGSIFIYFVLLLLLQEPMTTTYYRRLKSKLGKNK